MQGFFSAECCQWLSLTIRVEVSEQPLLELLQCRNILFWSIQCLASHSALWQVWPSNKLVPCPLLFLFCSPVLACCALCRPQHLHLQVHNGSTRTNSSSFWNLPGLLDAVDLCLWGNGHTLPFADSTSVFRSRIQHTSSPSTTRTAGNDAVLSNSSCRRLHSPVQHSHMHSHAGVIV